ncbi:MAG: hypothetical protein ACYC4T_09215 [Melioribacteraceae bacterium]
MTLPDFYEFVSKIIFGMHQNAAGKLVRLKLDFSFPGYVEMTFTLFETTSYN